nr:hypothetical protein [uncultured Pseudomonas sp.]
MLEKIECGRVFNVMVMAFREGSGSFLAGGAEHGDRLPAYSLALKKNHNHACTKSTLKCCRKAIKLNPSLKEGALDSGLFFSSCFDLLKGLAATIKQSLYYRSPFYLFYCHRPDRLLFVVLFFVLAIIVLVVLSSLSTRTIRLNWMENNLKK